MENTKRITQEIDPILKECKVELYELNWKKSKRSTVLQIVIMNEEKTMDIDTCALVSEKISALLDEINIIDEEFMLEVCSPGAERKLRNDQEIKEALDKKVYVLFNNEVKGFKEVIGQLKEVQDEELTITYKDKAVSKKLVVEKANIKLIRLAV